MLLKQELQAKRRKEEKEQEKHKEELMMERKRLEELKTKAKNDQEEKGATQASPKEPETCKQQEDEQAKGEVKEQKEDITHEEGKMISFAHLFYNHNLLICCSTKNSLSPAISPSIIWSRLGD